MLERETFLTERSLWCERWGGSDNAELVRREWIVFQESGVTREQFLRGSLVAFRKSRFYPTPEEVIAWGRAAVPVEMYRPALPSGPLGPDEETRVRLREMFEADDNGPLAAGLSRAVGELEEVHG
jgi:hypothetical protein